MLSEHIRLTLNNDQAHFLMRTLKSFYENFKPENSWAFLFRECGLQIFHKYAPRFDRQRHLSDKGLQMRLTPVESFSLLAIIEILMEQPDMKADVWIFHTLRAIYAKLESDTKSKFHTQTIYKYDN